jgi:putative transcriptional regulator
VVRVDTLRAARSSESLACHLLCAVPQLDDPNFKRSVVLLVEHGEDGALGLVLNQELPNLVAEVSSPLGLQWRGAPSAHLRQAGPVEPVRGWILHDQATWDEQAHQIAPGLWLTASLDHITDGADQPVPIGDAGDALFFVGYAGWGPHQLEAEIAAGSWVIVPLRGLREPVPAHDVACGVGVDVRWVFATEPADMWSQALRSIGVDPARLVGLKGGEAVIH